MVSLGFSSATLSSPTSMKLTARKLSANDDLERKPLQRRCIWTAVSPFSRCCALLLLSFRASSSRAAREDEEDEDEDEDVVFVAAAAAVAAPSPAPFEEIAFAFFALLSRAPPALPLLARPPRPLRSRELLNTGIAGQMKKECGVNMAGQGVSERAEGSARFRGFEGALLSLLVT